jgi:hypothetical protein
MISDGSYTGLRHLGLTVSSYSESNADARFDSFAVYPLGDAWRLLAEAREKASEERAGRKEEAFLLWLAGLLAGAETRWSEALAAHEAEAELCARYGLRWH